MADERLVHQSITPMIQSSETSCIPTSISMVFSGFGVDISEQTLVDTYFQTAKLQPADTKAGVNKSDTVKGVLQVIEDHGLRDQLQIDVFAPVLQEYTKSPEKRYLVRAGTRPLRKYGKELEQEGISEEAEFFYTLAELSNNNDIGVYTANARMLLKPAKGDFSTPPHLEAIRGFYSELKDFIKKGHIVGLHGGMTMHAYALDGSREEGFTIIDPNGGRSYPTYVDSLIRIHSWGISGDTFDYLFRVSPREEVINPQTYGFRKFLHHLRNSIP